MKEEEEEEDGAESLISSCLSMKSDRSKGEPLRFSNEPGPSDTNVTGLPLRLQKMKDSEEEEDGAESLISSCLSMKSDRSKGEPLRFSNEPGPSDTNVTGLPLRLQKMKEEEEEEDGAESLISSCLSMKSDRSKGEPLRFSNEPGPSDT
ncbi:LOW QUALITY PROTEIN: NACHT%2C LRR and PYD domains-containing protein 12-like, partial [Scomber scombrus]